MTHEPGERAWAVFDQLAEVPAAQRAAALRAACGDDVPLRDEVERLLALDDRLAPTEGETGFLQSPFLRPKSRTDSIGGSIPPRQSGQGPPNHVGRYRVLRLVGEGGMGVVYEAVQDSPHRVVALKVIRPGLVSPALLKRFAQEVEILGRLRHPGIAQIHDAGVAEDGQPFFAMEFIRGLALDEHARLHSLTRTARVELLARVADAVQHADDHGVVHRDLKPANILVDETGQPKVLDFGVARAVDTELLTGAGLTRTGQLLGTPSYMSPEQVTGDPASIDRRTDVYALGVILFELLTHRLPHQLENRPLPEAARLILEQDPPRVGSINPELRGDVETIVAKALEKNPARRYATAAELAADLRRWLTHEPILARPPSALYHLRKFAWRHKALVSGVAATVAALALGLVGTILFAVAEARQRDRAERNAVDATSKEHEALRQAYRARIAAATAAISAHDVADAARQLREAPRNLRDWEWRHLESRLDDSSLVIPLPAGASGLLGTPGRLRTWTAAGDGVRLTDLSDGESQTIPIGPERGHDFTVLPTRRGARVVAWVGNTTACLFDEAGQVLCRVEKPPDAYPGLFVMSPDGMRLACGWNGERAQIAVIDANSGRQTAVCDGGRGSLWAVTFSPDGSRLASGGEDNTARVSDPVTGALLATCRGHTSKVLGVAFSPDGARLVTSSADATVRQWDAARGQQIEGPYDRHSGEVATAVYSPDGQFVASAGTDRTIRLWRATGRQDVSILHGHTGAVISLAFAAEGRRLASASVSATHGGPKDDTVRVWESDPRATLPVLGGHTSYVYSVAFSPDGRFIASASWDGDVRLWDAATAEPCATLRHSGIVPTLAYSPDGRWLVTGTYADNRLRIWEVATARVTKEIEAPLGSLRCVTVNADGSRVAATSFDARSNKHHLYVCEIASGERLFSAEGWALAYSPDGRWLATRDADDKALLLLDARTHETKARFQGHEGSVYSARFSADSRHLASCGSEDLTVRVWRLDDGTCQVLRGHTDEVLAVAFSPDGRRLATGGRDRAVWLWDLARGEEVARLPGHTSYVSSLAFNRDGSTLASGSGDSTVRLWDTSPLKARYQARRDAAALRPEAERLLERLWQQTKDPAKIIATLRTDSALSEPQRHAAELALLRRVAPPESAK